MSRAQGGLEAIKNTQTRGNCNLGAAMNEVLTDAFEKDLTKRPCSILVLTAGRPNDFDLLEKSLLDSQQKVANPDNSTESPLSVTFIQIGDDSDANSFLKYLDKKMAAIITESGKTINNIVDVIKNDDI